VVLTRAMAIRALVAVLLVATMAPSHALLRQSASPRVIEVTAQRFEFWPSEIKVVEGEPVELRITSDDTMHGFRIVGGTLNLAVPKRGKGVATAPLPPLSAGRYTVECSRMCGAGHNFMRATIVVAPAGSTR
jgi:cytochrome c oxidase subunit II